MRLLLSLLFCALLAGGAAAQNDAQRAQQWENMSLKLKQLDLMNHILPLLMTKEQIKKILPSVEKARQVVKSYQTKEFQELKKFETRIEAAHKKALENGQVPGRELINEIMKSLAEMNIKRQLLAEENTNTVLKAFRENLNVGQIKAAVNDLNPKLFDPSLKPEEMSEEEKLKFYIREIFLDPAAYELLIAMSKAGS